MKHLLSIEDLDRAAIEELLGLSGSFLEVTQRDIPKVPALRGKVVVSLFYEDSTRTRISFETAAKRLSCDVMSFSVGSSSVRKGESLRDTVQTIEAMGIDALVMRHSAAGAPHASRTGSTPACSTRATAATSTRPRRCSTASRCHATWAAAAAVRSTAPASRSSATSSTRGWRAAACSRSHGSAPR